MQSVHTCPVGSKVKKGNQEVPVLQETLEMAFRTWRSWGQIYGQPTRVVFSIHNQKTSRMDEKEVQISYPKEVMIPLSSFQI